MRFRLGRIVSLCLALLALAATPAAAQPLRPGQSADRMVFWVACDSVTKLSDAQLDAWKRRGVDGFVCVIKHLRGLGGTHEFTGDPSASLSGSAYALQRTFRDTGIVRRAARRGLKLYLGTYLVNYWNTATPLAEWFDDRAWQGTVLPKMRDLAAAARQLGFAGLAFDEELYAQRGGASTATWSWRYPGNARPEAKVRAKVRQRGAELMRTLAGAFPGVELLSYDTRLPESWGELVQREVNGIHGAYEPSVQLDLWDGLTSVEGYGAIRLADAIFYKTPHLGTWDTALQYDLNRLYSLFSRRLSNWAYASSRLHVTPFGWISAGRMRFERARDPAYVAAQLAAFRKWGTGGEFVNYAQGGLEGFDYSPYESAMRAGSAPGQVDPEPPGLTVSAPGPGAAPGTVRLEGTATDNLAIRAVRWRTNGGDAGAAPMAWHVRSGDHRSGYSWEMRWSASSVPLGPRTTEVRVTVEDVKGHTTSRSVALPRGAGTVPRAGGRSVRLRRAQRRCLRRASGRRTRAARRAARRVCRSRAGRRTGRHAVVRFRGLG